MFSFFKKNKKDKVEKQGEDTVFPSKELLDDEGVAEEQEVFTELSIHPSMNVPLETQYVLRFLNNELPPLKPNQVSLSGIELRAEEDQLIVSAFVRNSVSKGIRLAESSILLIGPNGEHLARKRFDLAELGEIPAKSSRPWHFNFHLSDVLSAEIPSEGWKLAFEIKAPHRLDLDASWENALPVEEKEKLIQMVESLGSPKAGEVNFLGLQARKNENGGLSVTILIRNGNDKNIQLNQLPLQVEDAAGQIVAKGGFALDQFEVKANTSKPWTFIFPKELVLAENPDLSRWKVQVVEQKEPV
ncbi:accessory Sec system S-layer assembly protein [Bacillus sp. JJ1609]|uniref:accessory Sec system S-layer assembly protein n=1 Tax=Bacillus sp. JJ1609 TaxID=3122977 RepID=UPI002FFD9081